MSDGPGEFWKNEKMDLLLAYDPDAEKVTWSEFLDDFRTSFEPLDPALKAQLELKDLRMKERANEYTYQFTYLAKQTGLALKIMTRPEGTPTMIKDWMNAAILFDESYKQAMEYGKTWDDEHRGKKLQRSFRKKEDIAIKQITEMDRKAYVSDAEEQGIASEIVQMHQRRRKGNRKNRRSLRRRKGSPRLGP
ncbi:hypothetical protein Moror_12072 [Moniliophthora roreri MCA 2997]|uniref:Retrotransposon gag domain-containing protein n=1 Tax=Moniliophthora roreri (strain MCA 2997) TaxID=1381753 RepID=V2WPT3_MONRO|nr:hypothetical protein Moror_12072 [Moniliophthora roreri MCA 2997]